jgi:tetratricopeptide (TPR) repeat protein
MKSLEKKRARRYDTVAELSADIGRHLKHEPVLVTAPGMFYRLHKCVWRNKALVTGIATVLVVLIAGIIFSTLFAIGQARALKEAEHQTKIAQAISNYLRTDLIWSANPFRKNPEGMTAYSYLNTASVDLEQKFSDEPQVEAFIRRWIGTTYRNVSRYAEAEPHLERSVQLFRKELGDDHTETLQSMHQLVMLCRHQSRYAEAEDLAIKVFECRRRILGQDDINTLWSMNMVALVYRDQGLYKKAEPFFLEQLDISQRLQGGGSQ